MRVVSLPNSFYQLWWHLPLGLTQKAQERSRWLSCWLALREQRLSSTKASHVLHLPRSTLYRWQKRLKEQGPRGLEERSRRPKRRRQRTWHPELAQRILVLREEYPRWGKDKLVILLSREGIKTSPSMVGPILTKLKARGVLGEPPRRFPPHRRSHPRPYAVRKPRDYRAHNPGDLVQVDTLDVRPLPGVVLKHFTACDVVSRWDVLEVYTRATATLAQGFLDSVMLRMPFPVRAVQVDGGSEFQAAFEEACREKNIPLFVLPPRSPKLNGHVERTHRTHREEFYEVYDGDLEMEPLNQALNRWEWIYNHVRPRQALDNRIPQEYLTQCHPDIAPLSHM